ncbi:hypothetical protein SS59_22090 [Enterobacter hormaechei subsp. xiangfangensis]|uniref:Uncharacterized protein n=1 Tax=Enterobacter hormaechei subsp. xiangfangensis TaxID=1296536 RepID=A0A837FDG6_9ENTR|nr:hypothetical protein SS59_22090 [Enterobacter hormaechei subsp. xiangfangensis]
MKMRAIPLMLLEKAHDLKSLGVRAVWVQVPLRLPWEKQNNQSNKQCRETTERWFFCACNSPFLTTNLIFRA